MEDVLDRTPLPKRPTPSFRPVAAVCLLDEKARSSLITGESTPGRIPAEPGQPRTLRLRVHRRATRTVELSSFCIDVHRPWRRRQKRRLKVTERRRGRRLRPAQWREELMS